MTSSTATGSPSTARVTAGRIVLAALLDIASVVLFVALGREEHDDGTPATPFAEVVVPFLVGLAVAWVALRLWRRPLAWQAGIGVWLITVSIGMIVRRTVFDDGTAIAFVIVATAFLGTTIVGWRWLASVVTRRTTEA